MANLVNIPSNLLIGGGALNETGKLAEGLGIKKVLLVSDRFMEKIGNTKKVQDVLKKSSIETVDFFDVQPDPTVENVEAGLNLMKDNGCDGIVAIGGGSSLDTGKAISVMSTNDGWIGDYKGYFKVKKKGAPLIAIPTTAGTGSEVTKVVVITDTKNNVKMMCLDDKFMAAGAIVDYELTMSMPKGLTAAVGVDTLTHAIEAYVSKKANRFTDPIALSAIELTSKYLRRAYNNPNDKEAREGMMLASHQAGIAFSNSSVCTVHGMSRPIGAYFHVPHGLSNAMLLPVVTEFSLSGAYERYAKIAEMMGEYVTGLTVEKAAQKAADAVKKLNEDLNIPSMKEYGIEKDRYYEVMEDMAKAAIDSGSPSNNPKEGSVEELVELYKKAY